MTGQEEGGGAESLWVEKRIEGKGEELQRIDGEDGEKLMAWRNHKLYGITDENRVI